jgi:hypothetical protein
MQCKYNTCSPRAYKQLCSWTGLVKRLSASRKWNVMVQNYIPERLKNDQKTDINYFIAWNETYTQRKTDYYMLQDK